MCLLSFPHEVTSYNISPSMDRKRLLKKWKKVLPQAEPTAHNDISGMVPARQLVFMGHPKTSSVWWFPTPCKGFLFNNFSWTQNIPNDKLDRLLLDILKGKSQEDIPSEYRKVFYWKCLQDVPWRPRNRLGRYLQVLWDLYATCCWSYETTCEMRSLVKPEKNVSQAY